MRRKDAEHSAKVQQPRLHIEELEERIAPVIVHADNPILGTGDAGPYNGWGTSQDSYWIFYIGPGQADIENTAGGANLNGFHIGDITIGPRTYDKDIDDDGVGDGIVTEYPDMTSMLYILDAPDDNDPDQDEVSWSIDAGSLLVQGDINVVGSGMGMITIDGAFTGVMDVPGDLGTLNVGMLLGNVHADGDIWEINAGHSIGGAVDIRPQIPYWWTDVVTIAADGNIGAIRAGVGLDDGGEGTGNQGLLGGAITGATVIRANADGVGAPGIIDLIEVRAGSLPLGTGNLGFGLGDNLPSISAGPGGNVRFIRLDGDVWIQGPASGGSQLVEILVEAGTPIGERTIIDDSGGVMVINPEDVIFNEGTADEVVYESTVSYLVIPVDRATQGPGAVVARVTADGSASYNITGNVEIGELRIDGVTDYAEGQELDFDGITAEDPATSELVEIDDLATYASYGLVDDFSFLAEMEGYAHQRFGGMGEADIYFVNAMSNFGAGSGTIPIVINNTPDGDIVAAGADAEVIYIAASHAGGDIGATESITPYLIKGPLYYQDGNIVTVDGDPDALQIDPIGVDTMLTRYNAIYGVFSGGQVYGVRAGGAIGDVRALDGGMSLIMANSNLTRDAGSPLGIMPDATGVEGFGWVSSSWDVVFSRYGKMHNVVGDGVFGKILSGQAFGGGDSLADSIPAPWTGGGGIDYVNVGEGLEPTTYYYLPETGVFGSSGIFTAQYVGHIYCSNAGAAPGVTHGIYGDIIGRANPVVITDPDLTEQQTEALLAELNTAGVNLVQATGGAQIVDSAILGGTLNGGFSPWVVLSDVKSVSASGPDTIIDSNHIVGQSVGRISVSGGGQGLYYSRIFSYSGGIETISSDGAGIIGCDIQSNGAINTITTTGAGSIIQDTDIQAISGLKRLHTTALDNDDIYLFTLGQISTLNYIWDTTFDAGGIRRIAVRQDVLDSEIHIAGPLNSFTVNGTMDNAEVWATGPYGNIGRVVVRGDIIDSDIQSENNITLVQSRTGSIISTGDAGNPMQIIAKGSGDLDADLTHTMTAKIGRVTAKGDIGGIIKSGVFDGVGTSPLLNNVLVASLGPVRAGGDLTADISVGEAAYTANVGGDIDITARLSTIVAKGNIDGNISVGTLATTAGIEPGDIGDINGNVSLTAFAGAIKSTGSINGTIAVGAVHGANDINGAVYTNARLAAVIADGDITGDILVGTVAAEGSINGTVMVPEVIGSVRSGGSISGDLYVGTATAANVGEVISGDVTYAARVGSIKADGGVSSNFRIGNAQADGGVTGAVDGRATLGRVMARGGDVTGDFDVFGNVSVIKADGDVGNGGGTINIGGNLGRIMAGDRNTVGTLWSDVTVGGNAGNITATGDFPGTLDVGGNMGAIVITGDAGGAGGTDTFTVGGRLGRLAVGNADTVSDLLAAVDVGGNMGSLLIRGDVYEDVTVGGNTSRMQLGKVFNDIHVVGNLWYFESGSTPNPTGGLIDFILDNADPDPDGTLRIDGRIGRVI